MAWCCGSAPDGATYLPQVWEQIPDKVEFLNHLAQKAGCAPADWRGKERQRLHLPRRVVQESE